MTHDESLTDFEGGKGYWLVSTTDFSFSFNGTADGLSRQQIAPRLVPEEYSYQQSEKQAFFFVNNATIRGEALESNDVVIAYNGDVIVGSRYWNGELTDIPAIGIGSDRSEMFAGYCETGDMVSFKVWDESELVGGLYGIYLRDKKVFCGESMFSRTSNASRVALVHLCARLWKTGFKILDAQFMNPHLEQFGAYEIPQPEYVQMLLKLRDLPAEFSATWDEDVLISEFLDAKN